MVPLTPVLLITLAGVVLTLLVQAAAVLIWGASLTQRVKALESEIEPLKALPERFARVEVRLDGMLEQLKDLNASVRWMRQPAEYEFGPKGSGP